LDAMPGIRFSGMHFAFTGANKPGGSNEQSLAELETLVSRLRPAHYMTGHIRHQPDILAVLADAGCRTIVSIRDPRAIALSAANYMRSNQRHPLHARGLAELPELDDRINAVITGIPATDTEQGFPALAERLERYLPWLDEPGVCVVRYEDLIGVQGGGSEQRQRGLVADILRFLDLPVDDTVVDRVAESIYSTKSATFRLGQIDSWRQQMASRHIALINELCEPQMLRMGYPAS
ncbi:MAG: sulfotransferase domain-containing protein, partial [Geodermatophilaceae bacterium]